MILQKIARELLRFGAWRWLITYWLLLLLAMHLPMPHTRGTEPANWDKLLHFAIYGGLSFLLTLVLHAQIALRSVRASLAIILVAFLVTISQGAIDEWTQPWTGRDAEFLDWVADCAGAAIGALTATLLVRFNWAAPVSADVAGARVPKTNPPQRQRQRQ